MKVNLKKIICGLCNSSQDSLPLTSINVYGRCELSYFSSYINFKSLDTKMNSVFQLLN